MSALCKIRQLRCFLSVVKTGGFSAASREMGLTYSQICYTIGQLERAVGSPLFDRSQGREGGTELNDNGRAYLEMIRSSGMVQHLTTIDNLV